MDYLLAVIIHLQAAIRYSPVITFLKADDTYQKKLYRLSTSYLVDLTPLDKSAMSLGHQFSFGKRRSQGAQLQH